MRRYTKEHYLNINELQQHKGKKEVHVYKCNSFSNNNVFGIKLKGTNLVNRLELLCDCENSLNIVVAQLLDQVSNRWIVLKKTNDNI